MRFQTLFSASLLALGAYVIARTTGTMVSASPTIAGIDQIRGIGFTNTSA